MPVFLMNNHFLLCVYLKRPVLRAPGGCGFPQDATSVGHCVGGEKEQKDEKEGDGGGCW